MDHKELPIVGESIREDEWPQIEEMINELECNGFKVVKILNFIGGSTKFIAQISGNVKLHNVRRKIESSGWRIISPYFSQGKMIGFKVAKAHPCAGSWS